MLCQLLLKMSHISVFLQCETHHYLICVAPTACCTAVLCTLLCVYRRLDISDEFKQVISTLKGHDDKVRCLFGLGE